MENASPICANENSGITGFGANTIRFYTSSATNINLASNAADWCDFSKLRNLTRHIDNGNNLPLIISPLINPDDPDSYLSIEMHLKDSTNPINSYNLANETYDAPKPSHYPNAWTVSVSDDGSNWVEIENRDEVICRRVGVRYWYYNYSYDGTEIDGKDGEPLYKDKSREEFTNLIPEYFHFSGYKRDGLSAVAPLSLQVDAGASLDLTAYTEAAQAIKELKISAASGGGKIKGGRMAETGLIAVDMGGSLFDLESLAIELEATENLAALANWQVSLQGKVLPGVYATYNSEAKRLILSTRFKVYNESGEVNLVEDSGESNVIAAYVASGVTITNAVAIEGNGRSVNKFGPGKLVLTETSSYAGGTYIEEGVVAAGVTNGFGTGTVTLKCGGEQPCQVELGAKDHGTAYDNDFVLEGDSTSTYKAIHFITAGVNPIVLNGSITAHGNLYMYGDRNGNCQSQKIVTFNGAVSAVGKTIDYPTDNTTRWLGTVTAATFSAMSWWPGMGLHSFGNSSNSIGLISWEYNSIYAASSNALGGAVLNFAGSNTENGSRSGLKLYGHDQTVAYIKNEYLNRNSRQIDFAYWETMPAAMLTLTGGTDRAVAAIKFGDIDANGYKAHCSMTLDAGNDDFVQVFTNSIWRTLGTLTVKNGTMQFCGESMMTNMPSLAVEGGALEFDMVATGSCQNVKSVNIGAGARFKVGAKVADLFDAEVKRTEFSIASTSQIDLPEGARFTVNHLNVDGERLNKGTYTGVQGVEGTSYLPQINGSGRLTVLKGGGLIILIK